MMMRVEFGMTRGQFIVQIGERGRLRLVRLGRLVRRGQRWLHVKRVRRHNRTAVVIKRLLILKMTVIGGWEWHWSGCSCRYFTLMGLATFCKLVVVDHHVVRRHYCSRRRRSWSILGCLFWWHIIQSEKLIYLMNLSLKTKNYFFIARIRL